ncbi:Rho GTPase-activating protein gacY [Zancudomyces culisetae]|uniref:Rho GTPase-activating protein gacY n=1 Tax=Zancudomyces culisetae TaxID=1213189 RepID=A0A1R1PKM6_ZANCU|nr:Rho GTPase-activating protein gacY [Zancudomyces culisetae]|eukprot:OMH81520.1 Rho GTPase-activating protein gacY [Zancudomyces culisetae]
MMPEAIITWILYLNENGIKTEGIFRRSPASSKLREAKEEFDCEIGSMDCEELGGVHVIAVLLKMFFKELQIAIFDKNVYEVLKGQQKAKIAGVDILVWPASQYSPA